jgi:hypothetical protein
MTIELESFQLSAAAVYRGGLLTVVDAGIGKIDLDSATAPAQVTAAVRIAFMEPDTNKPYTAAFQVFNPDLQLVAHSPVSITSDRPLDADLRVPYTFTAIVPLAFLPGRSGLFTVRFNLDGAIQRDLKLEITLP